MPIEFKCVHCKTTLSLNEDSIGKMARCPRCGNMSLVGDSEFDFSKLKEPRKKISSPEIIVVAESVESDLDSKFDSITVDDSISDDNSISTVDLNPYRPTILSPTATQTLSFSQQGAARKSLSYPAMILAVLHALQICNFGFWILLGIIQYMDFGFALDAEVREGAGWVLFFLAMNVYCFFASVMMLKSKHYAVCLSGAVLSLLISVFCLFLSAPFAIWAIVILSSKRVRLLFRMQQQN